MVICPGASISTLSDVTTFASRECTTVNGSLIINNLNALVPEASLSLAFGKIVSITSGLSVINNLYLATLDAFTKLVSTPVVYVLNNDGLVDARIPTLLPNTSIIVENNRRLCPLNYPLQPGSCSVLKVQTTFALASTTSTTTTTASEIQRISNAITSNTNISITDVRWLRCHACSEVVLGCGEGITSHSRPLSDLLH